jgi:signal transduction histidine kinase
MVESLRARLLIWHTAIVFAVVAIFGGTVSYLVWRTGVAAVDAALGARAATLANALQPAGRGTFDLTLSSTAPAEPTTYHALWAPDGTPIDWSIDGDPMPRPTGSGTWTRNGQRELALVAPSGAVILVGQSLDELRREVWGLAALLFAAGGAVLALSVAAGSLFASRTLAPLTRINRTARRMMQGDLSARIPVERVETELGQVAGALNGAFDRLQASLDRQRRLTADVSHELRTPIATVSAEVQWALGRERPTDAYRESLAVCRRAATRMQAIVERLLTLARVETATSRDVFMTVALDEVVQCVVADLTPQAAARDLTIDVETARLPVTGDPDRLLEAITNVVANAVAYNVPGGRIIITMRRTANQAEIVVTDTGPGIAAADLPFIFDPFFRADAARTRDAGGAGLGLTLTRSIVGRYNGRVECRSEPGRGSTFTISLPISLEAAGVPGPAAADGLPPEGIQPAVARARSIHSSARSSASSRPS